jgi:hypothetical protein
MEIVSSVYKPNTVFVNAGGDFPLCQDKLKYIYSMGGVYQGTTTIIDTHIDYSYDMVIIIGGY